MVETVAQTRGGKGAKMLDWLFRPGAAKTAGGALYAKCAKAARETGFYTALAAPDTVEGRFELYALHVLLVVRRLRGQGDAAAAVSQALFDALLLGLDDGLREMGVGDLSVGKKMRKLGEALFGRARNLDAALDALPQITGLTAMMRRTVYQDETDKPAAELAAWVARAAEALQAQPLEALLAGEVTFPGVEG
jgi:cytochrome b pre-mRNA-processing protein 3